MADISPAISIALSILALVGGAFAYLLSNSRSDAAIKAKFEAESAALSASNAARDAAIGELQDLASKTAQSSAESAFDRFSLHKEVDRLERDKANRDVLETFSVLVRDLKAEIDRRFDRLDQRLDRLERRAPSGDRE